ncbi:MAG: chitobiase/beta-hexosaminidase C-terminal domain-containing protein, partial [Bacteroidales bacterium]|nr:chitobiase/beta-hexosaminidase C-terminal domain-containing protein [Bacteroidales bacterium]
MSPIQLTSVSTTVKAIACRQGYASVVTTQAFNDLYLSAPTIAIDNSGNVTITRTDNFTSCTASIYYTTDGTTPTTSSTLYTGTFAVSNGTTIKALVVPATTGYITSPETSETYNMTSGIYGNTVILNDWEDIDHWTYYTGVDASVDGGNYNNN